MCQLQIHSCRTGNILERGASKAPLQSFSLETSRSFPEAARNTPRIFLRSIERTVTCLQVALLGKVRFWLTALMSWTSSEVRMTLLQMQCPRFHVDLMISYAAKATKSNSTNTTLVGPGLRTLMKSKKRSKPRTGRGTRRVGRRLVMVGREAAFPEKTSKK